MSGRNFSEETLEGQKSLQFVQIKKLGDSSAQRESTPTLALVLDYTGGAAAG